MQPDSLLRVDLQYSGNGLFIIINQARRENIPNFINFLKLFKVLFPFLYLGYSYVTLIAFVIIGSRQSPEKLMMMILMVIMIIKMLLVIVMMMIILITIMMMTVMIMTIIMMIGMMTIIRILINLI